MRLLRELSRRKLRTTLTIVGITIGDTCDRIIRMRDGLIVGDERVARQAEAVYGDAPQALPPPLAEPVVALGT